MNQQPNLYLHEEILLLALKDKKGTISSSASMYQYIVGGAILAELMFQGRIKIDESTKRKLVDIVNVRLTGDSVLDECLKKVSEGRRRASVQTWVTRFAGMRHLKQRVAAQLCKKNILKEDEDKILLIFSRKIYPEINHEPEQAIIDRLERAIFSDSDDLDPRTILLLSLAHKTGLLTIIFDKKKLKERKKRIEKIVNGEIIGKAASDVIAGVRAAIAVTTMTPIMITTVSH